MEYRIIGDDGREYGPVGLDVLREWARGGRVSAFTMVLRADTGRWAHAAHYEELEGYVHAPPEPLQADEGAVNAGPSASPEGAAAGVGRPADGRAAAGQGGTAGATWTGSVEPGWRPQMQGSYPMPGRGGTVLALGLISILSATVFSCVCLGIFVAPIAGIAAWIMGAIDLRKIDAGLIPRHERSFTRAGMILGIIGTFLGPLLGVAAILVSVFSFFADFIHGAINGW
jgi:hypothetical protein